MQTKFSKQDRATALAFNMLYCRDTLYVENWSKVFGFDLVKKISSINKPISLQALTRLLWDKEIEFFNKDGIHE